MKNNTSTSYQANVTSNTSNDRYYSDKVIETDTIHRQTSEQYRTSNMMCTRVCARAHTHTHTHTCSQAGRETAANMFSDMAQEAVFVLCSYWTQWTLELSLLPTFHSQVTKQTFTPAVATSTQFAAELTIAIIIQMQPRQIHCIYNRIIKSLKLYSNFLFFSHAYHAAS